MQGAFFDFSKESILTKLIVIFFLHILLILLLHILHRQCFLMMTFFCLENNPRNFHCYDFQHCSARHHVEPYLARVLCFCYRRSNCSNDNKQRPDAADDCGYTYKREQSRCATAVDCILNSLIQTVPRRPAIFAGRRVFIPEKIKTQFCRL